jgi:hypothetical protein
MDNLGMDMIKEIGYLLIPGFAALFLLLPGFFHRARYKNSKAECYRHIRGNRQ